MSQCRMPNTMGKKMEYPKFESAKNMSVAMAYVPWQQWKNPYGPERGLAQGTIFSELDLAFDKGRCS